MKCFVIMPISDAEGYFVRHFNKVYQCLLRPAIEKAGFEAISTGLPKEKTSRNCHVYSFEMNFYC